MRKESKRSKLLKKLNIIQSKKHPEFINGEIKYAEKQRLNKYNPLTYVIILIYVVNVWWVSLDDLKENEIFKYRKR